jgi:hypothetical protein
MRVTYLGLDPVVPHLRLDCEACGRLSIVKLRNARSFPHTPAVTATHEDAARVREPLR